MTHCEALPVAYPGRTVAEIPALTAALQEVSVDAMHSVRVLRCRQCGHLWEERHQAGHGAVVTTRKLSHGA